MNKKILFLISAVALISPVISSAEVGGQACITINSFVNAAYAIAITMVVIGWLIAGILWLISGGSTEKTGTAKKATFAAAIGTAVVAVAYVAYGAIVDLLALTPVRGCP